MSYIKQLVIKLNLNRKLVYHKLKNVPTPVIKIKNIFSTIYADTLLYIYKNRK